MFRLYSKGCEYALRALMCVAGDHHKLRFQARDICERVGIPEPYTRKVFQALTQGGFLRAVRGPGGGYELTQRPEQISLLEVILAVDGEDTFDSCIMGMPHCGGENPCPLHPIWAEAKEQMLEQLSSRTLQDLVEIDRGDTGATLTQPSGDK